jgi:3-oxoadipate enol-lactonase/3-oxoadipate enol-lactonase/4-carboxymuconolactone decarboxylase
MLPLVLIPGIQGRWEYMQPTVDALRRSYRVLTFSLGGASALEEDVETVARVLDAAGVSRAVVCGVSFGGAVALTFAATHRDRTLALVLASTPGPGWHLRPHHALYARFPMIFGPLFLLETPWRLRDEIARAIPNRRARWAFKRRVLRTALSAPVSFSRMAARARLLSRADLGRECARIDVPTLVVTGEPALDHVVPAAESSAYSALIPNARSVVMHGTGHIGSVTKPAEFAKLVAEFCGGLE